MFLIRQRTGQWPRFQTEIHFHPSTEDHREAAQSVLDHYTSQAERRRQANNFLKPSQ